MVEIYSRDELREWLRDRPRDVAEVIAARAALRAAPFLVGAYKRQYEHRDRLSLASFRALAIAWSVQGGYNKEGARAAAAYAAAAYAADAAANAAARAAARAADAARAAAYAAARAAYAADAANAANAANAAYAAARAAYAANAAAAFWRAVSRDVEKGSVDGVTGLIGAPIFWSDGGAWGVVAGDYDELKRTLNNADPNWRFWLDWYQDRLDGNPQDAAFERALLSLTEEEWKKPVAVVNELLVARKGMGRRPAVSVFGFENGQIIGDTYPVELEAEPTLADGLYAELKDQLTSLEKRLVDFEGDPTVDDILNDIKRTLTVLGADLSGVNSGRLLGLLEKFEIAPDRIKTIKPSGNYDIPDDLPLVLSALYRLLKKFLGHYGPDLKLIDDRAAALSVKTADFDANETLLNAVVEAAARSDAVAQSAVEALKAGFDEKNALTESINKIDDKLDEMRIKLESLRAQEQAREIRNHENFGEILKEALREAIKDELKGAFGKAIKYLAKKTFGPLGGLASRYGTKALKEIVEFLKSITDDDDDQDDDDDDDDEIMV